MPSQRSFLFRQMVQARRFGFGTLEFEAAVGGAAGAELPVAAGAGVPVAAAAVAVGFSSELGDAEPWSAVAEAGGSAPGCDMVAGAAVAGAAPAGFSQRAGSKRRGE